MRRWRRATGPRSTISAGLSCHHVFGEDATILVPALDPPEYRDDDWWQDEAGVISFQNEVLKYFYCRQKY